MLRRWVLLELTDLSSSQRALSIRLFGTHLNIAGNSITLLSEVIVMAYDGLKNAAKQRAIAEGADCARVV